MAMNKDFYRDLPGMVCIMLDKYITKYKKEPWFPEAWEEYRQHILNSSMDDMKMPGFVFNKYLKKDSIKHFATQDSDVIYGIPQQKKFPLPDADHVKSAIKFFNYVEPKYEKRLAKAILEKADEFDIDLSEMNIGDNNRFKKYLPEELKHWGIPGMKWGIRRYQNPDGTLTPEGKERYRKYWEKEKQKSQGYVEKYNEQHKFTLKRIKSIKDEDSSLYGKSGIQDYAELLFEARVLDKPDYKEAKQILLSEAKDFDKETMELGKYYLDRIQLANSKLENIDGKISKEEIEKLIRIEDTERILGELKHWGIKGQKWGIRRYENYDGTLTPEGRERYKKMWIRSGQTMLVTAGARIVKTILDQNKYIPSETFLSVSNQLVMAGATIAHFHAEKKLMKDLGISDETYKKAKWSPVIPGSKEALAEVNEARKKLGITPSAYFKK